MLEYQDLKYCEYEGVGLLIRGDSITKHNVSDTASCEIIIGTNIWNQVSGRILIDHFGYHKHHEGLVRTEQPPPPTPSKRRGLAQPPRAPQPMDPFADDAADKESEKSAYVKRLSEEDQKANIDAMMKREGDLIFMSPILAGFSLKSKLWREFLSSKEDLHPCILADK